MKTSLKKICIFALAAGLDEIIIEQIDNPEAFEKYFADLTPDELQTMRWNAKLIGSTGTIALNKCRGKKDKSKLRQAEKKIIKAVDNYKQVDLIKILSFLFCGLSELNHYCKDKAIIQPVSDAVLNYITLLDPNLEDEDTHKAAFEAYEKWAA